jgi:hypothetical protein
MRKLLYMMLAVFSIGFAACDDYVDITPTGKKTVDSAATYYELIPVPFRGYYPTAFALLSDNTWSKESTILGHEDMSWDGINMTFNENASRIALYDNNLYENCYDYILRMNIVISNIDNSAGPDSTKQLAKAEAKLMRAWDHFVAVNTFAKAYDPATAATDGGIAIVDKYDLEATPTKSSVADVYNFIIKDIDESLPYLKENPVTVYHPSQAFGYAFSALVHLFHRDWAEAKSAAEKSLALNNSLIDYVNLETKGGPLKYTAYAKGGNPEVLNYAYMGSYSDNPTYTYGMLSPELVQLFGSNDERFNLFFKTTGNSIYYFDAGSGAALWDSKITYSKFQYMAVGLRTAEVYLILAEADARLNDLAGATTVLNQLRVKRIKGDEAIVAQPSTQKEMMQLIINERRKELLFGFHRFWDLKRFNTETDYAKTITRTFPLVSTTVEHKTYTLKPDSRLYIIPFPETARAKNPNLTLNTNEQ